MKKYFISYQSIEIVTKIQISINWFIQWITIFQRNTKQYT